MTDTTADKNFTNLEKRKKKPRQRTEKKIIQDRLAQRANRERTKQRIAALEEALRSLKSGDDPSYAASLTRTIASLRHNNYRLRSTLDKIQSMIGQVVLIREDEAADHKPDFKPWATSPLDKSSGADLSTTLSTGAELAGAPLAHNDPPYGSDRHEVPATMPSRPHVAPIVRGDTGCGSLEDEALEDDAREENILAAHIAGEDFLPIVANAGSAGDITADKAGVKNLDFDLHNNMLDVFDQTDFSSWNTCEFSLFNLKPATLEVTGAIAPDAEKWHIGNSAYFGALDSVKRRVRSATTMDFQVAFHAALCGWQNVGNEAEHPVWNALRQVDQRIFGTWTSRAQRIAMMYVCQTLIQYRENPTPENLSRVPGFLQPR